MTSPTGLGVLSRKRAGRVRNTHIMHVRMGRRQIPLSIQKCMGNPGGDAEQKMFSAGGTHEVEWYHGTRPFRLYADERAF